MFFRLALVALAALILGPAGAYLRVLPPVVGFGVFSVSAVLGLVAVIGGLIQWRRRRGRRPGLAAILGAVPMLVVGIPAVLTITAGYPRINDVSTDRIDPPTGEALSQNYPAEVADQVEAAYPDVTSLRSQLPAGELAAAALERARQQPGWTITTVHPLGFEGHAETRLFRFRDDLVVRVTPGDDGGSTLDMRSASRVGKSDLGVNAARITDFLAGLRQ
jgi:uncharacterized protein (DUF1499 family)